MKIFKITEKEIYANVDEYNRDMITGFMDEVKNEIMRMISKGLTSTTPVSTLLEVVDVPLFIAENYSAKDLVKEMPCIALPQTVVEALDNDEHFMVAIVKGDNLWQMVDSRDMDY